MRKTTAIILAAIMLSFTAVCAVNYETPSQASIRIKNVRYEPFPVEPGAYFDVWIRVENFGSTSVSSFRFRLSPEYPFSLDPNEEAERSIGILESGGQALMKFKVRTDINAVEGENPLKYEYSTGGQWDIGQLNINIHTLDAVLAVGEVVIQDGNSGAIAPGDKTSVELKLKNMADSPLKNVRVKLNLIEAVQSGGTVQLTELPISPLGSSEEKTIRTMEGGEEASIKFDLIVDSSAESKVYKIPLTITYNDLQGANYTSNNIISVLVGSAPDMTVTVESSTANMVGKVGDVVVKFVNKGFSEIKFLNVKLEETGDFELVSPAEVYIGNIDSDDYESAEFRIYVKESPNGQISLPLQIDYKDANNKDYEQVISLKTRIYTQGEARKLGITQGRSSVGIVILALIIIGGVYAYRKIRKKKKKQ